MTICLLERQPPSRQRLACRVIDLVLSLPARRSARASAFAYSSAAPHGRGGGAGRDARAERRSLRCSKMCSLLGSLAHHTRPRHRTRTRLSPFPAHDNPPLSSLSNCTRTRSHIHSHLLLLSMRLGRTVFSPAPSLPRALSRLAREICSLLSPLARGQHTPLSRTAVACLPHSLPAW